MPEPHIDPDEAAFAELLAMDLDAARKAHGQLMAATETDEINSLGRTYQRVARSLRQTLALRARLKRERAQDAARPAQPRATRRDADFDDDDSDAAHEWRIEQRLQAVQAGVGAVITAFAAERPDWLAELYGRFDRELDRLVFDRFFLHRELDDQVRDICASLELPDDLAAAWTTLPKPAAQPDPATRNAPPAPWAETG
jgi:hypothetical protein